MRAARTRACPPAARGEQVARRGRTAGLVQRGARRAGTRGRTDAPASGAARQAGPAPRQAAAPWCRARSSSNGRGERANGRLGCVPPAATSRRPFSRPPRRRAPAARLARFAAARLEPAKRRRARGAAAGDGVARCAPTDPHAGGLVAGGFAIRTLRVRPRRALAAVWLSAIARTRLSLPAAARLVTASRYAHPPDLCFCAHARVLWRQAAGARPRRTASWRRCSAPVTRSTMTHTFRSRRSLRVRARSHASAPTAVARPSPCVLPS